ncbi:MAG: aldo/keto reductase, partial [Chloroflexi bacterium]|nr:aldo/keto reductase [Chloroflexota bacterium]
SLIDRRPEQQMLPYCGAKDIKLLTYGTLAGGLLSDRYLGQPEPGLQKLRETVSLRKYKQMIDAWGGWELFQRLLRSLRTIADKHDVDIAQVAIRAIMDQPGVGGVIVGARLGISDNREVNKRVFGFQLDETDLAQIDEVTADANDLFKRIGDCGDEYRRHW